MSFVDFAFALFLCLMLIQLEKQKNMIDNLLSGNLLRRKEQLRQVCDMIAMYAEEIEGLIYGSQQNCGDSIICNFRT